jgi:hypothetical protein
VKNGWSLIAPGASTDSNTAEVPVWCDEFPHFRRVVLSLSWQTDRFHTLSHAQNSRFWLPVD